MAAIRPMSLWQRICRLEDLIEDVGSCALVNGAQIAVFRLSGSGGLFAIDNLDPFSDANVLARGIVGDRGGEPVVASPVYKQRFSLRTGRCLEDAGVRLGVYPVRVADGWVEIACETGE